MTEIKTDAEKAKEKEAVKRNSQKLKRPAAVEAEKRKEANEKAAVSLERTVEKVAAEHKAFVDKKESKRGKVNGSTLNSHRYSR